MKDLMFIFCLVFQSSLVFSSTFNERLQIYPKGDQYLLVGSDLHLYINCTTCNNESDFDVNNVILMKGSQGIHDVYYNYNDSAVELTIADVRLTDAGYYKAFYGDTDVVQSITKVSVMEEPGKPVNITCVSFEMTDLTCSFNLSKSTRSQVFWRMEVKLQDLLVYTVNCSNATEKVVRCSPVPSKYLRQFNMHDVIVYGVNETFKVNINKTFEVNYNLSIVKYAPVPDIKTVMGTDSVTIQWGRPKMLKYIPNVAVEYRITVKSDNDWIESITRYIYNSFKSKELVEIDGLIPYDNYTVSVWNKVKVAKGDIYWSDPVIVERTTLSAVSQHSVSMATGSYLMFDCNGKLCVNLFWKNPEERYWCGHVIGYEISVDTNYTVGPDGANGFIAAPTVYIDETNGISEYVRLEKVLSKTNDYLLGVSLVNTEGSSTDVSSILIPAWEKANMMKVTWVSVEMLPLGDKISWEINPDLCSHIVSVTIYWCLNQNSTIVECVSDFDWRTYDIENGCEDNWQLISTDLSGMTDLKYGISIENQQFSGGIEWEKFRFKNLRNVPDKPMFTANADDTMLTVTILYASNYVSEFGRPDVYYISYSKATQKTQKKCTYDGTSTDFPVDFSQQIYRIPGLEYGTQYYICVWSGNAAGLSETGEPRLIETIEDSNMKITIIVSCLISGVVVIAFVIVGCCFLKKWRRKIIEDNIGIVVPGCGEPEFGSTEFLKNEQDFTADSGKGDSPSTSVSQDSGSLSENLVSRLDKLDMSDELKPEDTSRNMVPAPSPVLPGYFRASKPFTVENLNGSNSVLDWQDGIDFDSGNSDEDDLPHSSWDDIVDKAAVTPIVKEMAKPNCTADNVDKFKNPIVNIQTYENPAFSRRPEHFYHEVKELEIEHEAEEDNHNNTSAKGVNLNDKVTLENQSTGTSILDNYNVAYVGSKQSNYSNVTPTDYIKADTVVEVNLEAGPVSNDKLVAESASNEKLKAGLVSNDKVAAGPMSKDKLETEHTVVKEQEDGNNFENVAEDDSNCLGDGNDGFGMNDKILNSYAHVDENFEIEIDNSDNSSVAKYSLNSGDMTSDNMFCNSSISVNLGYANPNQVSLGGGSTISETSDAEMEDISREASPELLTETLALCQDVHSLVTMNDGNTNDEPLISDLQSKQNNDDLKLGVKSIKVEPLANDEKKTELTDVLSSIVKGTHKPDNLPYGLRSDGSGLKSDGSAFSYQSYTIAKFSGQGSSSEVTSNDVTQLKGEVTHL
ncbi:receptor [Mactra antiquata]